jgi:hypothetical protein
MHAENKLMMATNLPFSEASSAMPDDSAAA